MQQKQQIRQQYQHKKYFIAKVTSMFCVFCSVWCYFTFFGVTGFPGIHLVSEKSLIDSGHLPHPIAIKKSKSCTSKRVRTFNFELELENTFNDAIRWAIVRRPQGVWLPVVPVSHEPAMNSSHPGQRQWGVKYGYGRPSLVNFTVSFVFPPLYFATVSWSH